MSCAIANSIRIRMLGSEESTMAGCEGAAPGVPTDKLACRHRSCLLAPHPNGCCPVDSRHYLWRLQVSTVSQAYSVQTCTYRLFRTHSHDVGTGMGWGVSDISSPITGCRANIINVVVECSVRRYAMKSTWQPRDDGRRPSICPLVVSRQKHQFAVTT